jgi:hypothetical protein
MVRSTIHRLVSMLTGREIVAKYRTRNNSFSDTLGLVIVSVFCVSIMYYVGSSIIAIHQGTHL